ncbi:uracil-DNA glycosylase [bacterium]|jgi:uracil-DNA glycosylase|nr:uracil-DNA glycosylase [bacterium]MBT6832008.1 uracil-DNA glycosylase [bacterium]MBT6996718.1 uracil-DNA glycosylase [bacterium]
MQPNLFSSPEELTKINERKKNTNSIELDPSWKSALRAEFEKPYFSELHEFLKSEQKSGHEIFPPGDQIFAAFDRCPLEKTKVVILGQDPYHGLGQCHGPCFSVNPGVKIPPSLRNIFKELKLEFPNFEIPKNGDLRSWCDQGVLMLNATLTVRAHEPMSHAGNGWENFTDAAIRAVDENLENVVFLLWGRHARAKKELIDSQRHCVLEAAHPSPFSANNGFFGCGHFLKTNEFLKKFGKTPIDWQT